MAARSSSSDSDYASNATADGKLVASDSSYDGPSEVMTVGPVKKMAREPDRSSFMEQHNDSQKDKGKVIISGTGGFDEITGGKVVTTKNLAAENSRMVVIMSNIQNKSLSETQRIEMDTKGECRCCFWDYRLENMIECPNRHQFCFYCPRRQVEEIIYGGSKAHASLSCMEMDGCDESIPFSEIQRALPHDVIERYEARRADNAVVEAKIEGLVYCPFCNIPYEADKCLQVLDCPNLKCLKVSCIQCKKLSHLPLRCEEGEEKSETSLRREVEERMTKAVIRECNKCKAELIKMDGCNKVRCRCGNTMCYVCRQTISCLDFMHFCVCGRYNAEPGKPCQICNRCSVSELKEAENNEALAAKEAALNEFVDKEPKLLDQEIGPPLERLKRQQSTEQQRGHQGHRMQRLRLKRQQSTQQQQGHQGHRMQRFPPNWIVPPQEFFRPGIDQLQMVAIPPRLPAPPHLFRFHDGHRLENTVVPARRLAAPRHFLRFDYGHQIENMAARPPPPGFFRFGDQLPNSAVPPPVLTRLTRLSPSHTRSTTRSPPPSDK